ncbi:hypothetical protein BVX94_01960 [bacterium B17]|nr:hypothetical protein BVX94_01960 [bacterium B17]
MNTEEKILAMEEIWVDLCSNAEAMQSPEWHETILKDRMKIAESGSAEYSDWESAKSRIRNSVQ